MLQRPVRAVFYALLAVAVGIGSRATAANVHAPASTPTGLSALVERTDSTRLGIVWTPATPSDSAVSELRRIAGSGVEALRVSRLPSDTVAARADSLGLELYVDLPVAYVSAPDLSDALAGVDSTVKRLRGLARRHRAVTHVGLARGADTTVPAACNTLRRWTDRLEEEAASLRTYYVTPFRSGPDRCADAVDQVLLDLRGHPAPVARWQEWQSEVPDVGLGAVGTWVRPSAGAGLHVPHSPERQARYLEDVFSQLLDSTRSRPSTVFVSRWRDRASPRLASRRYGLHDASGAPRPAARVVRGVYTGAQRAFAFPMGTDPPAGSYGLVLVGWGLAALLGGLYAQNVFVRQTVVRYFAAPGFYRDALRDGHDLHPGANGLLLGIVATALGVTGACAARLAASVPATAHVLAALPSYTQSVLGGAVERPLVAGGLLGSCALGLLLVWMGALVLVARRRSRFSFSQGLVLVVWPFWPVLPAVPLALAAGPEAPLTPSLFGLVLLGGAGLVLVYGTGRVLYDYRAVTDLSGGAVLLLGLLSPLTLSATVVLALAMGDDLSFAYLWHLVTLTS